MTSARLAGFLTRALGFAIDVLILDLATIGIGGALAFLGSGLDIDASAAVIAALAAVGWLWLMSLYLMVFWTLAGQTPGMRFMGIRVINRRGGTPGFARSLRRIGGMYLAALPLGAGFLLILVDDQRRGLQDRIAGTLVIHDAVAPRQVAVLPDRTMPVPSANGSTSESGTSIAEDHDHATRT